MQVSLKLVFVLALTGAVFAAPKKGLNFRNLYKDPLPDARPSHSLRIINGQEATPHQFPYLAFLEISGRFDSWYCSGTLITPKAILTAAHCGYEALVAYVRLGAHNINGFEDSQFFLMAEDFVLHSNNIPDSLVDDIAILRLPVTVPLNDYIQLARLPTLDNSTYAGDVGTVCGWGMTVAYGDISNVVRYTSNPILTNDECGEFFDSVLNTEICMSGEGGHAICGADSGGPLIVDGVQVGVASYFAANCPSGYPSVFTRISSYLDWIQENV